MIDLANTVCGTDFRATGRTLERLGLQGWGAEQIARYALEGEVMDLV
jgi:hypothetical protein